MDKIEFMKFRAEIFALLNTHPDISVERKAALLAGFDAIGLHQVENLGEQLNIGVFICDKEGKILYVNKANEELVGIRKAECVGRSYQDFSSPDGEICNVVVSQVLERGQVYSSLVYSFIKGIQLLESGAPIYDFEGNLAGAILIDQDVSDTFELTERLKNAEEKLVQYREQTGNNSQIIKQLNQQNIVLKRHFSDLEEFKSSAIKAAYELAYQAAQTDVTTLLVGETGTGKEVLGNYIFEHSRRNTNPFIKVNCAAIPEHLLESEMFGYVKGAFTGANAQGKTGMFELANNGTLFLDEIGELPMEFQAKLLRAIQQKEITRIGDTKTTKLNIRIIAATNRNLQDMVSSGAFRSDLYYRLNIFPISIPALRDRKEDIPDMAIHFLNVFNKKYNKNIVFRSDVFDGLCAYHWPGNIRELENIIERWTVVFDPYTVIRWDMIKDYFPQGGALNLDDRFEGKTLKSLTEAYEREILAWALKRYPSTRRAAHVLGVDHSTVVRKARALGIASGKAEPLSDAEQEKEPLSP